MMHYILVFCFLSVINTVYSQDTIFLQNGREVHESKSQEKKLRFEQQPEVDLKRNTYSLNLLDLMLKNISISIELVPGKGKTGITMPLTFYSPLGKAIENANSSDMGKYHKELATYIRSGFDFNYYPIGQRKYTPLIGISLQGAYLKRDVDVQVDEGKGIYQGLYFYFLGKGGVNIAFGNYFSLGIIAHAGVKTPDLQSYYFAMLGAVNVGVKF